MTNALRRSTLYTIELITRGTLLRSIGDVELAIAECVG
jgi:hypothetical protein